MRLTTSTGEEVSQCLLALFQVLQALRGKFLVALQLTKPVYQVVELFLQAAQFLFFFYQLHFLLFYRSLLCSYNSFQLGPAVCFGIMLFIQRFVLLVKMLQRCLGQFYTNFFVFTLYGKVSLGFFGLAFQGAQVIAYFEKKIFNAGYILFCGF